MNFQKEWKIASSELGLDIEAPFIVNLKSGHILQADVLLRSFGPKKGMLLFADSEGLEPYRDEVVEMGYGYSILGHPSPKCIFDRDSFIEMLRDWEWSGDEEDAPSWLLSDDC